MKCILFCICLILSIHANSQEQPKKIVVGGKNSLYYKADVITNELIDGYPPFFGKEKYIFNRVLGKDVEIYVDTLFKKYTIRFKDQDDNNKVMVYKYVRDYFIDSASQSSSSRMNTKIYLMESGSMRFMLSDFMDIFNYMDIIYEDRQGTNFTLRHSMKNVRRIIE